MPQNKEKKLQSILLKFYHQPVARVSTELLLSIVATILLAVFAIKPTLVTMSNLIKEIEDKQKLEDQMQKKIAALSTAQTEYQAYQDQLYLLDEALPPIRPELITGLKIVEKLAADNKLIISGLNLTDVPEEEEAKKQMEAEAANLHYLDFRVQVVGDYPSIKNFVTELYQSRRIFVVDSISFSINEERDWETLSSALEIYIPYLSAGSAPTDTDTGAESAQSTTSVNGR